MRGALAFPLVWLVACNGSIAEPEPRDLGPDCGLPLVTGPAVAFTDVVVLSFDGGQPEVGRTVLVEDGRITSIGVGLTLPDAVVTLPGCGRYLVPGLADMHVHLSRADLNAYLRSGVTTVRNLWGFPDLQAMQSELDAGELAAPTIYGMSPGLDGTPEKWPLTQLVMDPADAPSVVRRQIDAGWNSLKLYQDLRPAVFDAIVAVADQEEVAFGGHVPHRVGLERALDSGYRHIEHLSGYELALNDRGERGAFGWRGIDPTRIPDLVGRTLAAGTWNCPTLSIFSQIASGNAEVVGNRQDMVKALFDAGAPLLIGTDSGIGRTQPGISVHEEIAEFMAAGLSPLDALRIATVEAARFLGEEDQFGRVAPGLRADLLLVRGNPLADPSLLSRPDLVMARGRRVQ